LIKEPAKKHSHKPAKTIQAHGTNPPNIATNGQTTVPFFGRSLFEELAKTIQAHGTPNYSNRRPDNCTFFFGRNLIDEGTPQKT
jgi:hypothetical protein